MAETKSTSPNRPYCETSPKTRKYETTSTCSNTYALFNSEEDMNRSLSKLCHGDTSVIGRIWIYTLRVFLLGFKCPITYTQNLPKCESLKQKRPEITYDCQIKERPKIIHNIVLPYVSKVRHNCQISVENYKQEVKDTFHNIKVDAIQTGKDCRNYFRDDENFNFRAQLVASGCMIGFLKPGGLPTRLFWAACGLGATGMLCFPEETGETIGTITKHTVKAVTSVYNYFTDKKSPEEKLDLCKDCLKSTKKPESVNVCNDSFNICKKPDEVGKNSDSYFKCPFKTKLSNEQAKDFCESHRHTK